MGDPKTANIRDLLNHLAQYLATPPTLSDEDYHHLTLTSDGKLRTDDPTTQAKIDTAIAALAVVDGIVDDILIEVGGLDGDAMRGTDLALLAANYVTERGTDNVWSVAGRELTDLRSKLPEGALSATMTTVVGSGWIIEVYAGHRPAGISGQSTSRTISLAVDGGAARIVLALYGVQMYGTATTSRAYTGAAGVTLLTRYTTGFTVSSAVVGGCAGSWALIYIPD